MTLHASNKLQAQECVILLHGLARSSRSFNKMASVINKHGYYTVNYNYPSTKHGIDKLADDAISEALSQCPSGSKIHFVTHSMGGILVRHYLSTQKIANMGHVIMLGPPNKGSEVVDTLKFLPGFNFINGPAGFQLGTDKTSTPNTLGAANFSLGIIAGTRSINLLLSMILPKPNDGKVSVENTKLEGMSDHISLPVTHPFMMRDEETINQVLFFLKIGKFKPAT